MTELVHRRRPGVAFAGFAVAAVALLAVVLAHRVRAFADAGWAGGEYATAFACVAIGAVVAGAGLQTVRRPSRWQRFGVGLLVGGSAGVLFTAAAVVTVLYAFSRLTS
jgi:hypothetical protein